MNNLKRYEGLIIFIIVAAIIIGVCFSIISPTIENYQKAKNNSTKKSELLGNLEEQENTIRNRLKDVKNMNSDIQKKIYSPVESDLDNDTLFFTLYSDFIEMIHANSIKIKSIDYKYNPEDHPFVASGKDYFVFDVNVELVSNYTNLGKLIQDIYQYPYFLKINSLIVKPYNKDKKILISNLSVRLYAHTEPEQ